MNRYLRAATCEGVTSIKFLFMKGIHGKKFSCSVVNICSSLSGIEISKGGILCIGKRFKMRSNSHIKVRTNIRMILGNDVSFNYDDNCVIGAGSSVKGNV